MKKGKNRKNFEIYSALEFIAAITQHIPNKFSQLSRHFCFYSNKSRGLRAKAEQVEQTPGTAEVNDKEGINIIDVSQYQPKKVPSLTWCECIKKIWKDDPLICPECQSEMRIISFICEGLIISKILKHLGLWEEARDSQRRTETARAPPPKTDTSEMRSEARSFEHRLTSTMRDRQSPINRILWVSISRIMSVIAKTEQLCFESGEKLEKRNPSKESCLIHPKSSRFRP